MNKAVLEIANKWEATGKAFFHRNSDNSMTIVLSDPRLWGGNPNVEHWQNAQDVEAELRAVKAVMFRGIEIDKHAGQLTIRVEKVYTSEQEVAHDLDEDCGVEGCQTCCTHDERDHGICLDCAHEEDPGKAIDRAMDALDASRDE